MIKTLKDRFRKINIPLVIGSIIVIFFMIMAFYPKLFTSKDPLFEEKSKYITEKIDGKVVAHFKNNPLPPSKDNIFGTDDGGRDVYSRIIYGASNTMKLALLVAVFRMILALPLGIAAGIGVKFISNIIKIFNTFFTAIPMLIFSFLVLNIGYFRKLQMDKSIFAFAIVLTIVGWGKLAGIIEDSTRMVMNEDFIEGEIAIGKNRAQIAYENVLPHIIPITIGLFFKEMGMALFLIAQLAVLYIFVGVSRPIKELSFRANYEMNLEPEWGGSLSRISQNIKKYHATYWMTIYPVLTFSLAIIGINLTGEGLRIEFQKRDSRVISSIKKLLYLISPKVYIFQIKSIKHYYKPVIIKTSIIIAIVLYVVIPWNPSIYKFNIDEAKGHLNELTKDEYEGRLTGTKGGNLAGEYIINTLKSYGYEVETTEIPILPKEGGMPDKLTPVRVESGWIRLKDDKGQEKTYYLNKDFSIATLSKNIFKGEPTKELYYHGFAVDDGNAVKVNKETNVFQIDRELKFFSESSIWRDFIEVKNGDCVKFDIEFTLEKNYKDIDSPIIYDFTNIIPFDELRKELECGYKEIEVGFDYPKLPEYQGRNISGFLPGKGKTKNNPGEVIIIGANYDGFYVKDGEKQSPMSATPASIGLEVAKILGKADKPLKKSIEFVFLDNGANTSKISEKDGAYDFCVTKGKTNVMAMIDGYYYFDISYPGYKKNKKMSIVSFPGQAIDSKNYLMNLEIEKRLETIDANYEKYYSDYATSQAIQCFRLNSLASVSVGNSAIGNFNCNNDTMKNVNYESMENIGQILLDTITMNSYLVDK